MKKIYKLKNIKSESTSPNFIINLNISGMAPKEIKNSVYSAIKDLAYFGENYCNPFTRENNLIFKKLEAQN